MKVLDDEGRLLGLINLVDALVVLFVLAVIVAGTAFVFGSEPEPASPQTVTRHVTLNLGTQPAYVATLITEGDSVENGDDQTLTVTDVYSTNTDDGRHVRVRAEITGPLSDETVTYAGDPLRVGRDLSLTTDRYQTTGTITAVDASSSELPVDETDVLLRTTLPSDTAALLEQSDEYEVSGRTVATIKSITVYRTSNSNQLTAYVGVGYQTYRSTDGPQFGSQPVREGATLPFETGRYSFAGEVVRYGAAQQRGQPATRTVTLELENADPDVASTLQARMTERTRGDTVVRLTEVSVEPATVVLTSQNGDIFLREHPVEKDVTMTAELQVRETATGVQFKGSQLRQGETVYLDFGTTSVEATVIRIR